jgi:hypothetical protein
MSLQIKSIQLTEPGAAAATMEAAASTAEGETPSEEAATKEAEATAEATCLD